jgi:superfamily II RNA helicase
VEEYQLDSFQKEAIYYINQGYSVIVSAPTGAGKTAIAEYVIENSLQKKEGVIYTAPIKALSNQKFRDFQNKFPEKIGILTGDVAINQSADVLIMTTEIFRNKILEEELKKYSWVIFDEIHYIDNFERGTVWEESLIFLPEHMNLLALSATIPNVKEFASWIETVRGKPLKIVIEEKRPVPLHFLFFSNNEIFETIDELKNNKYKIPNQLDTLIKYIFERKQFPCIYFVFDRKKAEEFAWELYNYNFLNKKEKKEIVSLYESLCEKFNLQNEKSALNLYYLIKKGIAYHHAGMLPTLKEVIERLFTSRLLKIIFTTETFALGINMPSRTVVFDRLKKFDGKYVRNLKTRDFYQMAGRAGRRGMDREGFVYCNVNLKEIKPEELERIIYGKPEEVKSQLNLSYATILNLYERYREKIFEIYSFSFHYFQATKQRRKEALRLLKAKLELLKELNYIKNGDLTEKGEFAKTMYGYELITTEMYFQGILEQLDKSLLSVIVVAIVFEPRKSQKMPHLFKKIQKLKNISEEIFGMIKKKEAKYRIYPFSKKPYFHLSLSVEKWLGNTDFERILSFTDVEEGEVVRYFRMAIQILRELQKSKIISEIFRERVIETIKLLNRDIIDAEKQLRINF